jgi:hypothetical protein
MPGKKGVDRRPVVLALIAGLVAVMVLPALRLGLSIGGSVANTSSAPLLPRQPLLATVFAVGLVLVSAWQIHCMLYGSCVTSAWIFTLAIAAASLVYIITVVLHLWRHKQGASRLDRGPWTPPQGMASIVRAVEDGIIDQRR